jgi:two-component system NarL family sensor kinase
MCAGLKNIRCFKGRKNPQPNTGMMIPFHLLLIYLAIFLHIRHSFAFDHSSSYSPQQTIQKDSNDIFESLIRSAQMVLYYNPDSARAIAIDALTHVQKHQTEAYIRLLNLIGTTYHLQANYVIALDYYYDAMARGLIHDDKSQLANIYNNIGIINLNTGNFKAAHEFFQNALDIYESLNQERNISSTYNNIGLLFRELNNTERAKENFQFALKGFTNVKDSIGISASLNNIGWEYLKDQEYSFAFDYFDQAEKMALTSKYSFGICVSLQGKARVFEKLDSASTAVTLFEESIALSNEISQPFLKANALLGLSRIFLSKENITTALLYANKAIAIAGQIHNQILEYECHKVLSEIYQHAGNYSKSLEHFQNFHNMKDGLLNQTILHQIHNLEVTRLNQARQLQQTELNKKELAIRKKNELLYYSLAVFVLLLIGLYMFYVNHRNRQQMKLQKTIIELNQKKSLAAIEAELQERKRIGQELHDALGQLLSVAGLHISVLQQKEHMPEKRKKEILDAAMQSVNQAFAEVRNISHNLAPTLLSEKGLEGALKNISDHVNQSNKLNLQFSTFGLDGALSSIMENTLFRAIQEIVSNSIKHSNANNLYFQIARGNDEITLMAEDDGVGFEVDQLNNQNGSGLAQMKTRIDSLNGTMHIDSKPERGTIISIFIPLNLLANDK